MSKVLSKAELDNYIALIISFYRMGLTGSEPVLNRLDHQHFGIGQLRKYGYLPD